MTAGAAAVDRHRPGLPCGRHYSRGVCCPVHYLVTPTTKPVPNSYPTSSLTLPKPTSYLIDSFLSAQLVECGAQQITINNNDDDEFFYHL